jgi:hypothetical protein
MLVNGDGVTARDWTMEQVFAGERLYCSLQVEVAEGIDIAMSQVPEAGTLSMHETTGIIAHSLMETAIRLIMAARMPCSLMEFENAARLVYRSCHAIEEQGGAHIQQ